MGKDEIYWAIFTGEVLIAHTMNRTKKRCIWLRLNDLELKKLPTYDTCRKVVINEWKKDDE